ncbi:MAG: VOC family protein [Chloroflexi bacterium]|nr:VOC family protein [Chloroflexota bacterium]
MTSVVWVEVPVKDIERAARFYKSVFQLEAGNVQDDGARRTLTLFGDGGSGGPGFSLNQTANFEPGDRGIYVYIDCGADLSEHLGRIEPAGGIVVTGKTYMAGAGYYASVKDTEGNLFALYSVT